MQISCFPLHYNPSFGPIAVTPRPLTIPRRPHRANPRIIRRDIRAATRRNHQGTIHRLINIRLIAILLSHIVVTDRLTSGQVRAHGPQRSVAV